MFNGVDATGQARGNHFLDRKIKERKGKEGYDNYAGRRKRYRQILTDDISCHYGGDKVSR